jgi:fibronectin-binding autotransporter adhesin
MKVQSIQPVLKQKIRMWILPASISLGLFSANVSQAAMTNNFSWIGGTSTNAASSVNYTNLTNGGSMTGFNLAGTTNAYVYRGTNTQTGTQVLDYGGAASVYMYGLTVTNWAGDVVMTNFADWRVDSGNLVASNSNGSTLWIMGSNAVGQLGGSPVTFSGNMSVYVTGLSGHSTSARILNQNLTNLVISNFTVNNNSTNQSTSGTQTFLFSGTGNTTIIGSITNKGQFLTNGGNLGYLAINSGTLNIATISSANTNWASGLVLSNNGSVYVLGQLSLGAPMFDVKVGGANVTNRTTFGLLNTSSITSITLTNNFVISNSAAATHVFKAQSGKTMTLSGTISGSVNGTVVADAGTLVVSGANTALSLPFVVTNSGTLVASNNNALGSGSVTVASGSSLNVNAAIANSVVNNGAVVIAGGGSLVTGNGYSGVGSLTVGATAPSTASFTSSLLLGTNNVGPLSLSGNATLGIDVGTQIKSSGTVAVSGTANLITVTGTPKVGTNSLVVGTSLTGASASTIALNGSAVGSPATPIALGDTFTATDGNKYTFTSTSTALQLVVEGQGAQDLAYANATGLWNTDPANTPWKTVLGGVSAAFKTGDSTAFTNTATVTVDNGGVSPNVMSFSNPSSTAVDISGGAISATTVTANGAGSVKVSSDLTATAGITLNSGNVTLAKTTVNSGGITVAGGSLTNSGTTTIMAGGLNVTGGAVTSSGSTTISAGGLNVSAGSLAVSGSISAGAVSVTGGTVSGSGSITGSSYSVANAAYNVPLTGNGALTVSGSSTLGGNNSGFSGAVSLTGGNINLGGSSSLGTGALNLSGGSVITLSSGTLANSIALGASGGGISNSEAVIITGAVTNATGQVNQILSKSGAGVLTLSGTVGTTNPMIGFSINEGTLQLAGSQYYMTNLSVASGAKLLINGGVLNTRQIKAAGPGVMEVTNVVTWSNSLGSSSFTNPILIDANSSFISGPMSATTYSLTFESGVSGPGYLEINRCVDQSVNTNNINGWIGVGSMKVNTGALLKIANGGFTNPSATITNLGKILINNSSSVSNIISTTYPGVLNVTTVTNKFTEISGGGVIANSGSQTIAFDGLISGSNKISMEGSSASSSIYLLSSNSFTGGIDFAAPAATNNNGTVWFLKSNALGSGPINNSINSSNAAIKTYTPSGGFVQDWTLTNTVNTGTVNTAVMAFGAGASNSLTLVGKVSGGGQLKVSSSAGGELRVANMGNDYTGGTEVGTGAIVISNAAVLGTGPVNFGTTADSILKVTDTTTLTNTMTISGISGTSTNTTAYTAYLDVSANKTFTNSGGLNNKLSVGVTTNEQKYGGNLVKQGSGTAELSGVNGYSGSTTINDGTLALSGATLSTPLVSLTGSSNAVLKLKSTSALSNSVNFTGDNASATTGTVDFNAAGSYTFNRYGDSSSNPGLNIAFTNSSGSAVTATFTNATNYITDPTGSGGGKTIWNRSTNLTLVFSGTMEIGSSTDNNFGLSGDGNFTINGIVTNSGTGIRGLNKVGAGTATLNAVNSYNGATTVSGGTLDVGASGALPAASQVTVSSNAILKFNKSSGGISVGAMTVAGTLEQNLVTITSSGAVDLSNSTLKVNGTPTLESYTLVEGSSVTGTPTLSGGTGYQLSVDSTSVKLVKSVVGSTYSKYFTSGSENETGSNGLTNLMNYALGQNGPNAPFPAVPVLSTDSNGMTLTATARTDDSSLRFYVEWTTDLSGVDDSWHATEVFAPNLTGTIEYGGVRKFLRFKVTK